MLIPTVRAKSSAPHATGAPHLGEGTGANLEAAEPKSAGENGESWLDLELDRVWLLSERCLRRLQREGLRASSDDGAVADVERILRRHHRERGRTTEEPLDEAALEAALAECEHALMSLRPLSPLGRLARYVGLRATDFDTLIICLAPHTDPPLGDIFALLQKAWTRRGVDLALVGELLSLERRQRVELLSVLDADRPLLSLRLLSVEGGDPSMPTSRSLAPGLDIVPVFAGQSLLSSSLERVASLIAAPPTLSGLVFDEPVRESLHRACAVLAQPAPPWLILWGPEGVGKSAVAARIAASAGYRLLALDTAAVKSGSGDEMLRRAQRDALLHDAVLYIGPVFGELLDDAGQALIRRLRTFPGRLIFGIQSFRPPRFRVEHRPVFEVRLGKPSAESRLLLWQQSLAGLPLAGDLNLDEIARNFRLTPGQIHASGKEVRAIVESLGEPASLQQLRDAIQRRLRNQLSELAEQLTVTTTFDDLVLSADQLARVEELISRASYADIVFGNWGFGARVGWGRGLIALFSGPPGTGKTMLASLIAKELGLDIYRIDLSRVVSKWVGETEKHLSKIFDLAEQANAVLLFDEADALLAGRTRVESANDRYSNLEVNYLLQRLEQYEGIAILTSNRAPALDPALQRRLSIHLRMEVPDAEVRAHLWESFLPRELVGEDGLDYRHLAHTYEFAGGYIKNVALRAAFFAAGEGRPIDMELVERAARLETEDMGRLV